MAPEAPSPANPKRARQSGAALIEFAIVTPLLFMLLMGMVTGGIVLNDRLAVTNGVREGSRYGSTLAVAAASCPSGSQLDCWLAQVATVTEQASEGELGSTVAARQICVAYVYPSGTSSVDRTRRLLRTAAGDVYSNATCFDDGRPGGERRVQVSGQRDGQIQWVLGTTNVTLTGRSVSRFEATSS